MCSLRNRFQEVVVHRISLPRESFGDRKMALSWGGSRPRRSSSSKLALETLRFYPKALIWSRILCAIPDARPAEPRDLAHPEDYTKKRNKLFIKANYIHIYIYIERERDACTYTCMYVYIYIYIHIIKYMICVYIYIYTYT